MNVILTKELFMSESLTWQAVLFIALAALQFFMLIAWTAAKAFKAWKDAVNHD